MTQSFITGISSMATRQVLSDLADAYGRAHDIAVRIESVGGVDAARRVQAGEPFDLVVLADDAIDKLAAAGCVLADSRRPIVDSAVSIAVHEDAPRPDISTAEALRDSVLAARSIGYSTGPSGTALLKLFDRWGIREALADRLVQAPAGVPVGTLVAQGTVELGFQQYSELLHVDGISVLGDMPPGLEIITTFTGAIVATSPRAAAVRALLDFMTHPDTAVQKRERGMRVPAVHTAAKPAAT
jgi:molybdate transport system substrate-binding protein